MTTSNLGDRLSAIHRAASRRCTDLVVPPIGALARGPVRNRLGDLPPAASGRDG